MGGEVQITYSEPEGWNIWSAHSITLFPISKQTPNQLASTEYLDVMLLKNQNIVKVMKWAKLTSDR